MTARTVNDRCSLIFFDSSYMAKVEDGWIGDEKFARIYRSRNGRICEIRIFKQNGESYQLPLKAADEMIQMKISKLIAAI